MPRLDDIPRFDAADYLRGPRDCASFLVALIEQGDDDDLRAGLAAVARATSRGVGDLPREIVEAMLSEDGAASEAVARFLDGAGLRGSDAGVRPA